MGCYNINQIMELRRMRWLDKFAKIERNRFPRKFLNPWINNQEQQDVHKKQQSMEYAKLLKTST